MHPCTCTRAVSATCTGYHVAPTIQEWFLLVFLSDVVSSQMGVVAMCLCKQLNAAHQSML